MYWCLQRGAKIQLRQGSDSKLECANLEVWIGIKHAAQVIESRENHRIVVREGF